MLTFLFTKTPLTYFVQNFWRDEAFTYVIARLPFGKILTLTAQDFNPPFYYLVVSMWMRLFGSSEIALRSLSLLFYAGTAIVAFLILEHIFKFSAKKAHLYIILFFLNPLLLYNAFEARMYAMLAFFATLSWYCLKKERSKLYIFATVLGLFTHYFMLLVVASQLVYIATSHFLNKKAKVKDYKQILMAILLFSPWLIYVLSVHKAASGGFWILKPAFDTYNHMPTLLYTGYEFGFRFFNKYLWGLTILLNIIPLYGLYKVRKQKGDYRDIYLLLTSWAFVPVFITFGLSFVKPLFLPRYLIASSVGFTLLLIYILDEFPRAAKFILVVILIAYSSFYIKLHVENRTKVPIKNTIDEIKTLAKNDEPLYVTNELDFFTAQYYFYPDRVFIYSKNYGEIPAYTGKILIPSYKIVNTLPYYPNKAFVLNENVSYSIQALY